MGDWKKEARKKKAQDEAIDHCFIDADKLPLSDAEKQQKALECGAKVLVMPLKDLEVWNAAHAKEAPPSPPPAEPPPSPEATLYAKYQGCQEESEKATSPEEKEEYLDYCQTKVVQEYQRALAKLEGQAQAQRKTLPIPSTERREQLREFCNEEEPCTQRIVSYHLDPSVITKVGPLYELRDEGLRFGVARPTREGASRVQGEGPIITRKFTLIPIEGPRNQLPVPEQFFVLFQKIVNQMIKLGMDDTTLKTGLEVWRNRAEKELQAIETKLKAAGVSPSGASEDAEEPDQVDSEELKDIEGDDDEVEEAVAPKVGTDITNLRQKWQNKQRQVRWLNGCYANSNVLFAKVGLISVENFYLTLQKVPAFGKFRARCKTGVFKFLRATGPLQLTARVWRAAAQFAYFSVREYRRLLRTLPVIITALGKLPDPTVLLERGFPEQEEYEAVRNAVTVPGLYLKAGHISKVALGGWCRHVRNFVKRDLVATQTTAIKRLIQTSALTPTLQWSLETWLAGALEEQLKAFLKTLSRRLTKRVKRVQYEHKRQEKAKRRGKSVHSSTFGKGSLDKTILGILGGRKIVELTPATWKTLVKPWRGAAYTALKARLGQVPVTKIVQLALAEAIRGLTPTRLLARLWAQRPRYVTLADASWETFQKFLEAGSISEAESRIAEDLRPHLRSVIQTSLSSFQTHLTEQKVPPPVFTKQTIPLGTADTQMYEVPILTAAGPRGILKLLKSGPNLQDPIIPIPFTLHTPRRFQTFVDQNYSQGLGTLQRKGARLILAIPFQRTSQTPAAEVSLQPEELSLGGSIDLGLKTLVVLHKAPVKQVAEGQWEEVKLKGGEKTPEQKERERPLFIDQRYLEGERSGWIAQHSSPKLKSNPADSRHMRNQKARRRRHKSIPMGFNWKRRLTTLQEIARQRQAAMATYRQETRVKSKKDKKYNHKWGYWRLRREYKQAWQKIQDLHKELAYQLATRVIAACQQAHLMVLRMEDLSWSQHSPKWKAGGFLTTWQVHWFFSQVQGHITDLAARIGLRVEFVNARHTSTRCSHCGHEQKENRDKKRFRCLKCGFRLDADLNAARNILVAPLSNSPDAIASVGR